MVHKQYFKYDKNYLLKQAQADIQASLLQGLVTQVVEYYQLQYNPLGLVDDFIQRIHACEAFQLNNLEELYEEMAAIYRFQYGSNQLELLFDGSQHTEKYKREWTHYFTEQTKEFCLDKSFLKAVIEAAILFPADRKADLAFNRMRAYLHDKLQHKLHKYKGVVPMKLVRK
jgi:hypothetical protein